MRKFYKIPLAGRLIEITGLEYARMLRIGVEASMHSQCQEPMQGFIFQGNAYFVMEGE